MKRNVVFILLALSLFFACRQKSPDRVQTDRNNDTLKAQSDIRIHTLKEEYPDTVNMIRYTLEIPATGDAVIDRQIRQAVEARMNAFRERVIALTAHDGDRFKGKYSEFTLRVLSAYSDEHAVSFMTELFTDIVGAAHPGVQYIPFNFRLSNRQPFPLNAYVDFSATDSTALKEKLTAGIGRNNLYVSSLNQAEFALIADSVLFFFGDYALGSYADGRFRVAVPKSNVGTLRDGFR